MEADTFKILTYPNPTLRNKNLKELTWVDVEQREEAFKLLRTMYKFNGVGLSAPQVGLPYKVIVMDRDGEHPVVMFNPFIVEWGRGKKANRIEGCLSFPKLTKMVRRTEEIVVRYRDVDNVIKLETYSGLEARIIAHEIEHLNGILLVDH